MRRPLKTLLRRIGRATPSSSLLLIVLGAAVLQSRPEAPMVHPGRAVPTTSQDGQTVLDVVRMAAQPITGNADDFDQLLSLIGDARFVLLGEATHGTHEFYATRAAITRRLIEEKGFGAVAIEGNWTNAARVDRYVRGTSADEGAEQALADFVDFPRWMWRNIDVRVLVEWLRLYNLRQPSAHQAGFYGLDLYGLFPSVDATIRDLELVAPWSAEHARERYRCFAQYENDPYRYGGRAGDEQASCQEEAEAQFQEILRIANEPRLPLPREKHGALFSALQNVRVVKNGEAYFRTAYQGSDSTWNMRDRHMVDTLQAVANYHNTNERAGKVVAWAHNTHMGDVRATQLWEDGQLNVGQMMRERYKDEVVLVGFTTYTRTVMAASEWGEEGQRMDVRPAIPDSYAALFHDSGRRDFLLTLRDQDGVAKRLSEPRLERAIGVLYLPQSERFSHYFDARMGEQFDAVLHFDETRAVEPLDP